MSKTKKLSKVLALVIMLALVIGVLPMGAMATTTNMATFTFSNDANVATATVTGSGTGSLVIIDKIGPTVDGNTKSCQVELSPNSTASGATIALEKSNGDSAGTLTVTLPTTTPSTTYVTSTNTTINGTTYEFVFVMETSYTEGTSRNDVYIELPDAEVSFGDVAISGTTFTYAEANTTLSGFPQYVSLRLVPGGSNYDNVSNVAVALATGSTSGVTVEHQAGTYYTIYFPSNGSTAVFTVDYSVNGNAHSTTTFSITMNYSATTNPGSGITSFIPAPGQFVNEGVGTGGWGDIHKSNSSDLKNMITEISSTGVSLGAFGGSIVFDFGTTGISNTANNLCGVDFIIYGNAFSTNAEPGCVQVAEDDGNGKPAKWYDIAGSLYYSGETVTMYYRNPKPSDNTTPFSSTRASIPYTTKNNITFNTTTTQTWLNESTMGTNTFHNHSWFPLARNYFDGTQRDAQTYTGSDASGDMAHLSDLIPTNGTKIIDVMENQNVNNEGATTVMYYKGRLIPWLGAAASNYTFGYADVHANGSNYGTTYGTPSNPYATTGSTTGGDGIDISWAVDDDGTPVELTKIRFVRVYTGVQQVTGFGEVSTEVCGIKKVNGGGSNTISSNLIVKVGSTYYVDAQGDEEEERPATPNFSTISIPYTSNMTITVTSSDTYLYVNGSAVSRTGNTYSITSVSSGDVYQIITQRGNESPYITVLRIS